MLIYICFYVAFTIALFVALMCHHALENLARHGQQVA